MNKKKVVLIIAADIKIDADVAKNLSNKGYGIAVTSSYEKSKILSKDLRGIGLTESNLSDKNIKKYIPLNKYDKVNGNSDLIFLFTSDEANCVTRQNILINGRITKFV